MSPVVTSTSRALTPSQSAAIWAKLVKCPCPCVPTPVAEKDGVVSYANSAKESFLGVKNETLEAHGSVSEPVVVEMAEGSLNLSGADIAVAISGIAGPGGGTEEKPVGTVWFAWAVRNHGKVHVETGCQHFDGDRDLVRELAVVYALQGVMDRL